MSTSFFDKVKKTLSQKIGHLKEEKNGIFRASPIDVSTLKNQSREDTKTPPNQKVDEVTNKEEEKELSVYIKDIILDELEDTKSLLEKESQVISIYTKNFFLLCDVANAKTEKGSIVEIASEILGSQIDTSVQKMNHAFLLKSKIELNKNKKKNMEIEELYNFYIKKVIASNIIKHKVSAFGGSYAQSDTNELGEFHILPLDKLKLQFFAEPLATKIPISFYRDIAKEVESTPFINEENKHLKSNIHLFDKFLDDFSIYNFFKEDFFEA